MLNELDQTAIYTVGVGIWKVHKVSTPADLGKGLDRGRRNRIVL
jgi:hypothetical protein